MVPLFGQPLLCLLSPIKYPSKGKFNRADYPEQYLIIVNVEMIRFGNLYTMFLYSPLLAFACVAGIKETDQTTWTIALQQMTRLERATIETLANIQEFGNLTLYQMSISNLELLMMHVLWM
jgi:hypothetical protein